MAMHNDSINAKKSSDLHLKPLIASEKQML